MTYREEYIDIRSELTTDLCILVNSLSSINYTIIALDELGYRLQAINCGYFMPSGIGIVKYVGSFSIQFPDICVW